MTIRVDFSGRSIKYTEEEVAVVVEAMQNANPLTQGRYLQEFEKAFARYQGVEEGSCFAVSNGASALELCGQLCQFKEGDEFVIPSHTFTASAYPFIKKGGRPVWCDVDPVTHVASLETIQKAVTARTKAVVVVHLYGYVADMPAIAAFCKEKGLILIEDAAQAIGSVMDGKRAGSFGDLAIFSFHSHKNLTTLGEGGMLYVKDKEVRKIIPMVRHNGHCGWDFVRQDYWKPAMGNVDLPSLHGEYLQPNNYSLGEVECALGTALLKRIDAINTEKRKRALFFIDSLAEFPELVFLREETPRHNYHLLVAYMKTGVEKRDAFMRAMYEEKGIRCVVQYIPLNRYDYYVKLGFAKADCPNGDSFFDTMVSFPFHLWMSDEDFAYMLQSTREVLASLR